MSIHILFAIISQIQPLDFRMVEIGGQVVYGYAAEDSVYVLTLEGWRYGVVYRGEGLSLFIEKVDSVNLKSIYGISDSIMGYVKDSVRLYILTDKELLIARGDVVEARKKVKAPVMITAWKSVRDPVAKSRVAVLCKNDIYFYEDGKLKRRQKLNVPILYVNFVDESTAVGSGKGYLLYYDYTKDFYFVKKLLPPDKLRDGLVVCHRKRVYPYIPINLAAVMPDGRIMAYIGENLTDSNGVVGYFSLFDRDSLKPEAKWVKAVGGYGVAIRSHDGYALVSTNRYYSILTSEDSIIGESTISFIDIAHLQSGYLLLFTSYGKYEIVALNDMKLRYFSARFNDIPPKNRIGVPFYLSPGDSFIFLIGSSNWYVRAGRVYALMAARINIDSIKALIFYVMKEVSSFSFMFIHTNQSLLSLNEIAGQAASFAPDSLKRILALRDRAERIQKIKWGVVFWGVRLLILIVLLWLVYMQVKNWFEKITSGSPRGEVLRALQGSSIWHSIFSNIDKCERMLEGNDYGKKLDSCITELESIARKAQNLLIKNIADFFVSGKEWQRIFLKNLFFFGSLIKMCRKLRICYARGKCSEKVKASFHKLRKRAENMRDELRNLVEKSMQDIINAALVPAIEKCQRDIEEMFENEPLHKPHLETNINVRMRIKYYHDEVERIRYLLEEIFSNAIAAIKESIQKYPEKREYYIRVTARDALDGIEVIIEDNGVGMPPEIAARLTREGISTKGKGRGYGLIELKDFKAMGLLTYGVESEVGKGTKFIIKFLY